MLPHVPAMSSWSAAFVVSTSRGCSQFMGHYLMFILLHIPCRLHSSQVFYALSDFYLLLMCRQSLCNAALWGFNPFLSLMTQSLSASLFQSVVCLDCIPWTKQHLNCCMLLFCCLFFHGAVLFWVMKNVQMSQLRRFSSSSSSLNSFDG